MTPSVLIVILNYRSAGLTIDCLKSLMPQLADLPRACVVVSDNCSNDDSLERITECITTSNWTDRVFTLPLPRNGGFAYGNNAAIRPILDTPRAPDYVLLLNPDTVLHPGAVAALLDFMQQNPDIGIAGSRLENPDGTAQVSAFRFPSILGELERGMRLGIVTRLLAGWVYSPPPSTTACPTDWVAGASMIIRKHVFDAIGLFDEDFFMYYEEVDFCRRAAIAGLCCWYVPASRVVHLVGQVSGVSDPRQSDKRRPSYWFDSRRRYFLKNLGPLRTMLADTFWMISFAIWRIRCTIQRKKDPAPRYMLRDFLRHSVFAKGFHA